MQKFNILSSECSPSTALWRFNGLTRVLSNSLRLHISTLSIPGFFVAWTVYPQLWLAGYLDEVDASIDFLLTCQSPLVPFN
jgi:hypothetical protein